MELQGASFAKECFIHSGLGQAIMKLRTLPRQENKMANLSVGLQLRVRVLVVVFYTLSIALLWFVKEQTCRSYMFTWWEADIFNE